MNFSGLLTTPPSRSILLLALAASMAWHPVARADTWLTTSGAWNKGSNWNLGTVPGSAGGSTTASFTSGSGTPSVITLDNGAGAAFSPSISQLTVNGGGAGGGLAITAGAGGSLNLRQGAQVTWNTGTAAGMTQSITANVTLQGDASLNVTSPAGTPVTLSGAISGASSTLSFTGGGGVTLSGANTFGSSGTGGALVSAGTVTLNRTGGNSLAGNLTLSGGTVVLGQSNQISDSRSVTVNSGIFDLQNNSDTVGAVHLLGGSITSGTGVLTSTTAFDMLSGAVSARLGGTVGLNKTGPGTVTLTGANTYTGTTTVSAGTLNLNTTGAPALAGSLLINGGNVQLVQSNQLAPDKTVSISSGNLSMGTRSNTVAGLSVTGGFVTGTTAVLTSTSDFDIQAGTISAALAGAVGLRKTGAGTATLSGANTYTGLTTVSAGTLNLNTAGAPAVAGDLIVTGGTVALQQGSQIANGRTVTLSGGTLDMGTNSNTVGGLGLTGGTLTGTSGILTSSTAVDAQAGTISARLGGTAGLTKTTAGTVTLSGANTYSGLTTVSAGTLYLNSSSAAAIAGPVLVNGGTLALQRAGQIASGQGVTVTSGTFALAGFSNTVAGLKITGGGISGTSGTLTSTTNYDVQGGTISAKLGGVVGLDKSGADPATLSASNTFTGTTTVSGGNLFLASSSGLALAGHVVITGGSVVLQGANQIAATKSVTLNGAGGSLSIDAYNNTLAAVHLVSGSITGTTGILTSSSDFDIQAGSVSARLGGGVGLSKTGAGTATLSGANTFSGDTTVSAGTLNLNTTGGQAIQGNLKVTGGTAAFLQGQQMLSSKSITVSGGTLSVGASGYTVVAGLQLKGNGLLDGGGGLTSTSTYDLQSGTVNAMLAGSVGANVTLGQVTLQKPAFYGGITHVYNGGSLILDSAAGPAVGSLTIDAGSSVTLRQNDQVRGNLTVNGGTFNMGAHSAQVAGFILNGNGVINGTGPLFSSNVFFLHGGTVNVTLGGSVGAEISSGSVTLAAPNGYAGATHVAAGGTLLLASTGGPSVAGVSLDVDAGGTATLQGNNQLSANTSVSVYGVLDVGGHNTSLHSLVVAGSLVGTGTITGSALFDLRNGTVDAVLAGAAGVTISTGAQSFPGAPPPSTGLVTLTRDNTYTGATTIEGGGTLTLLGSTAAASTVIMSGGTLTGTGTIHGALNATAGTYTGTLKVEGPVTIKDMSGSFFTIASTAVLTATSGVTLDSGWLNLAGKVDGNMLIKGGTLNFNGTHGIITQTLTASGGTIQGIGTVGGLSLASQGSLRLGSGALLILSSGQLSSQGSSFIQGGGTLATGTAGFKISGAGSLAISSNLYSTGGLVKTGSGTLELGGTAQLGGAADIRAGTFTLDGTLFATQLILAAGTTFNGTGTLVGALVNNGGTFNPGHSPGTLFVNGDFTQGRQGTLVLQVQSPTVYDRLVAAGTVRLAGTLSVQDWKNHRFSYGDIVPGFVQAGRIEGRFSRVVMPSPGLRGRLLSDGRSLTLLAAPASYTLVAASPNQRQAAGALDHWIGTETGDVGLVTLALDAQRREQYPAAFNAISPAYYTILPQTGIEQVTAQNSMLQQRFAEIHSRPRHAAAPAPSPTPAAKAVVSTDRRKVTEAPSPATFADDDDKAWTSWMRLSGQFAEFQTVQALADSRFDSASALVGLDHRLGSESAAGIAASYNYTHLGFNGGDRTVIDAGRLTLYGAAGLGDGFFLDGSVSGGYTNYDIKRPVRFSFIDRIARGRTDGTEFSAAVQFGKQFHTGSWTLTPSAGFQYARVRMNGLNEADAGALNLAINGHGAQSMRGILGAMVSYQARLSDKMTLSPYLTASWQHEFDSPSETVRAALPAGGGSFRYDAGSLGADRMLAGAGLMLDIGQDLSLSLGYQAEFGSGDYESHLIMLMVSYKF